MSQAEEQLAEDRTLRDAALLLFKSDLALVKADLRERGIAARIGARIGASTMDMVDDALDFAEERRGTLAAIAAALVAWFARGPIIDAVSGLFAEEYPEEPEGLADRLRAVNPLRRE